MSKTSFYVAITLLLLAVAAAFHVARRPSPAPGIVPAIVLPDEGPLTLAAAGDIVIGRPIPREEQDAAFEAIVGTVRGAALAVANLEMTLLTPAGAEAARRQPGPRWPLGTAREAEVLETLGFDVVGHANNHALDYDIDGMQETRSLLSAAGLMTAGSGRDLDEAGAPVIVGGGRRKAAIIAVTLAASSAGAATRPRGGGQGWPGINALRYAAEVTADGETYETLRKAAAPGEEKSGDGGRFTLHGTVVTRGKATSVNLVPDAADVEGILAAVARARAQAEVVVVSLHSHEPSNLSQEPADFVRVFARQAIDAGAQLVVGHGPHRLRGVEVHNGGAILHSLGNFLYHVDEGDPGQPDDYGAGLDMFSLAMGMRGSGTADRPGGDADASWEGAVAVATFDGDRLAALQLYPVDLRGQSPPGRRGIPRQPAEPQATSTLETLVRLSSQFGTTIQIENGVGNVQVR